MKLVLVLAALLSGCYAPTVDDCQYRCSDVPNRPCPGGMFCNSERFCVTDQAISCEALPFDGGIPDAIPGDGSMPIMDAPTPTSDAGGTVDAVAAPPSELTSIHETRDDVTVGAVRSMPHAQLVTP
jgi:hypothetical protein